MLNMMQIFILVYLSKITNVTQFKKMIFLLIYFNFHNTFVEYKFKNLFYF